mgnify:CR=1 FL=1|jgi:hypothetical protein
MDPNSIQLEDINKLFEYEMQSREIDECNDIEKLRTMLKISIKLYMKQQEVIKELGFGEV